MWWHWFVGSLQHRQRVRFRKDSIVRFLLKNGPALCSLGWVGSLKLQVHFPAYSLFHRVFYRVFLQRSLIIVAIPWKGEIQQLRGCTNRCCPVEWRRRRKERRSREMQKLRARHICTQSRGRDHRGWNEMKGGGNDDAHKRVLHCSIFLIKALDVHKRAISTITLELTVLIRDIETAFLTQPESF